MEHQIPRVQENERFVEEIEGLQRDIQTHMEDLDELNEDWLNIEAQLNNTRNCRDNVIENFEEWSRENQFAENRDEVAQLVNQITTQLNETIENQARELHEMDGAIEFVKNRIWIKYSRILEIYYQLMATQRR